MWGSERFPRGRARVDGFQKRAQAEARRGKGKGELLSEIAGCSWEGFRRLFSGGIMRAYECGRDGLGVYGAKVGLCRLLTCN